MEASGNRPPPRGGGWIELAVFMAARYGVLLGDRSGWLPEWLRFQPLFGLSWVYFLQAVALVAWRRHRGDSFAQLGLSPPAGLGRTLLLGLAGTIAAILLDSLSMPLIEAAVGTTQDLSSFRSLVGNPSQLASMLLVVWLFAALGEEVFFRGWLMGRLARLLGGGPVSSAAALLLQAGLFGLVHLYQGPAGMMSTTVYGLVYGTLVLRSSGNLWAAVLAHGIVDTIGVVAIYAGALPT